MKYLLDSLQRYENGFADAMSPIKKELQRSFLGEAALKQPVSAAEMQQLARFINQRFGEVSKLTMDLSNINLKSIHMISARPCLDTLDKCTVSLAPAILPNHEPTAQHVLMGCPHPHAPLRQVTQAALNVNPIAPTGPPPTSLTSTVTRNESAITGIRARKSTSHLTVPIPGAFIPALKAGPYAWKNAIEQWELAGGKLSLALKDWPTEWYTGAMREVNGAKRAQRKLIADEYNR